MTASAALILAFGESLVAGYGLPTAAGFAVQLKHRLSAAHPGARVINGGVPGNTTSEVLRLLPRGALAPGRLPDLAIVQLGRNEVLREVPPSSTLAER